MNETQTQSDAGLLALLSEYGGDLPPIEGERDRADAFNKVLPAGLLRQVVLAICLKPSHMPTYAAVYEHFKLNDSTSGDHIPWKTFMRCAGERRARWATLQREQLQTSVAADLADIKAMEEEVGSLADVTTKLVYQRIVSGMLQQPGVEIKQLRMAASMVRDFAAASQTTTKTQIDKEQWAAKKRELTEAVEEKASATEDGKLTARDVADLMDRIMRGEEVN